MTTILALLFMLASAAVAVLGFASAKSDIQLIIGILGVQFAGAFLVLASIAATVGRIKKEVEDVQDQLDETRPAPRKDAAQDFASAVAAYQREGGHDDGAAAIRALATDALRQKGFLR